MINMYVDPNDKLFMWSIALYPVLSVYDTFLSGCSIGDVLIIIAFVMSASKKTVVKETQCRRAIMSWNFVFFCYCLIILIIVTITGSILNSSLVLKRTIKYGYFVIVMVICTPKCIDADYFKHCMRVLSRIVCGGLIIQYVLFYLGGYYITLKIPFLTYANDALNTLDYNAVMSYSFRPCSIFVEPGSCTYFLVQGLILNLFSPKKSMDYKVLLEPLMYTVCMLLTVSSSGLLLVCIVWIVFIVFYGRVYNERKRGKIGLLIGILGMLTLLAVVYINNDSLSYSLKRMNASENEVLANAVLGRLSAGKEYYFNNTSMLQRLFGAGLGNYTHLIYTNSIYFLLYSSGYLGTGIMAIWFIVSILKTRAMGKCMLIVYLALCFSSPIIYSGIIMSYNLIVCLDVKSAND